MLRILPACFLAMMAFSKGLFAQGSGLTGFYYDTESFSSLRTTRLDEGVNFDFGTGIPAGTAITNGDTFSIVWSGQIEPEFSALYTFHVAADDGARLWINDQLIVLHTAAASFSDMRGQVSLKAGQRVNIRLEYMERTGGAKIKLEWSCAYRARDVIPISRLYPTRESKAGGSLMKEHWSGIPGASLVALTTNPNYPDKPGGRELIGSFECLAQDWADSYGTRVTGFIVPPATGEYSFAVSGNDVVDLYLSTDSDPANKSLIAGVSGATAFRAWGNPSTVRSLVQGRRYYVELLHKEESGDDHWSVGWRPPGESAFIVIPGSALVQPRLTAPQPTEQNLLNTMALDHPRLFATAERFARLKAAYLSAAPSQPKSWATGVINSANAILLQSPVAYSPDNRGTILDQSRLAKDRIYMLATAWQMTGNSQYAERAWSELQSIAAFPDWNPAHFLDTAEMTHACAIGYDWLYLYWTPARRDTIRNAIIGKGLMVGLGQYTSNQWWTRSTSNNWNIVCNGGMSLGALAVGTESEALVENILNRAINSTRPVWQHFTTDNGAWYQGPGYWDYTTEYGMRMLAGLEWVLGSDFGISSTTNVSETGFAPIYSNGTSNTIFNFADAWAGGPPRGAAFQWCARRYGQPLFNGWVNQGGGGALEALWHADSTDSLTSSNALPDMAFSGDAGTAYLPQEMVTMRGRWNDSRASFIGCKGGHMGADHGNLDAGTFVFDSLGKRWFHELGGDDYALPGYFNFSPGTGADRWDYYRMRAEGQNTLTIGPGANADMVLGAVAPLLAYQTEAGGTGSFAIHNLTPVYSGMSKVWRGTRLMGSRNQMLVQDEIQSATGKNVWWFAHYSFPTTAVTIAPDGTSAMMVQGAERVWCKILSGGSAFQIRDAVPLATSPNPVGQNANTGFKKLAINLTDVTNATLAVWFVPLSAGEPVPTVFPALAPLSTWNLSSTNDSPSASQGVATSNDENAVDIDLRNYVNDDSTPAEQMRFTVNAPLNGAVILLADGFTARFTPAPGYTGLPSFSYSVTDTGTDPRMILSYDFNAPYAISPSIATDASGNGRNGTIDLAGAGGFSLVADQPTSLGGQGARSIDLVENTTGAARVQRVIGTTELDWNSSNWTVTGWFKRRDTANDDFVWHLGDGDGFGTNDEIYLNCPAGSTSIRLQHFANTGYDVDISQPDIAAGTWHHFAVVRSGNTLSLYMNGILAGSDSSFSLALNQGSPLVFGGHANPTFQPDRWFNGQLDDLAVFNAPLDPSEITSLSGGQTVRHFGGRTSTASISLSAAVVNHVWTNTNVAAALPWTVGTNWQSGNAPTGSRGASVQFLTGQVLTGGTITTFNDLPDDIRMNNLMLAGTSSAASNVVISGGSFHLVSNGILLPSVSLAGTSGSATNSLTYTINTPITLGADTNFSAANSGTFVFNGGISGPGKLARSNSSSKLVLAGTNTYTGDTIINTGTLQIGNDGPSGTPGTGDIINNGQLRFDRTGTLEVANSIGGAGSLHVDCPISAGTIILSGTNTFDGSVNVNSGTLRITNSTALGDGQKMVTLANGTAGLPQLRLDGSANPIELPANISFLTSNDGNGAILSEAGQNVIAGPITLTSGGGSTRIYVNAGKLALNGTIAPNTTNRSLRLCGAGDGISNGSIINGSSANVILDVSKLDSGSWMLAGTNTHSGTTSINAGRLILGNPSALGNGGSQFGTTRGGTNVASGSTLDLNGQQDINEQITINGSGISAAGALVNNIATSASIAGGVISSISTNTGGVHSVVPNITVTGGGGAGATLIGTLGLSAASFNIVGGTTSHSVAPNVTISGGGGTGATATAVLTGGIVSSITLTYVGTGYTSSPTLLFSGGTVIIAGTNPTGIGNSNNFVVSAITVNNPGSGYTSVPSVSFSSGSGTVATANLSTVILSGNSSIGGTGDVTINAPVSGSFALTKVGIGSLTLAAPSTYSGPTTVSAGKLVLAGNLIGPIVNHATLAPRGNPSTTGAITLGAAGVYQARLNNTIPGSGYDQLSGNGAVSLNGLLNIIVGPNLAPGSSFTIINKTSPGATTGSFIGMPENSSFSAGGYMFRVNYNTGTGQNDVWLTLITSPIQQWRFTNFGSMLNAGRGENQSDNDGDGVPNLIEYAMNMNPALGDSVPQLVTKTTSTFDFVYSKNTFAADVTFTVQWSDTLLDDWSSTGVGPPEILSEGVPTQQIKVAIPMSGDARRRFVRLKLTSF